MEGTKTKPFTIGRLAQEAGINLETVRFYERKGLLPKPPRSSSGYRLFPSHTVQQLRFIKRAQELGFSLSEIRELLALRVSPRTTSTEIRKRTEAKIADIEAKIKASIQCGNRYSSWLGLVAAAFHFPSAPFWKVWTGRMDEQNVETKLGDDFRCGYIAVTEADLSILLARLRRSFEFGWIGFPNICRVPVAGHSGFSGGCCWSIGSSSESTAWLLAFLAWSVCRSWSVGG